MNNTINHQCEYLKMNIYTFINKRLNNNNI